MRFCLCFANKSYIFSMMSVALPRNSHNIYPFGKYYNWLDVQILWEFQNKHAFHIITSWKTRRHSQNPK